MGVMDGFIDMLAVDLKKVLPKRRRIRTLKAVWDDSKFVLRENERFLQR